MRKKGGTCIITLYSSLSIYAAFAAAVEAQGEPPCRKEGQNMQKDETILIYQIYNRAYDGPSAGNSLLSAARREYFTSGGHVSRKESSVASGEKISSVCKIGKNSFVWSRKCEKQLLQKAFTDESGYYVASWNRRGSLVSKMRFSKDHRWISTAYYAEGMENTPVTVLRPQEGGDGIVLLEWDADTRKYKRTFLEASPMRRGSVEQSLTDARLGAPQIYAETSIGDFCYCTPEEAQLRETLMKGTVETLPEDITLRTEHLEEENPVASFTYIENKNAPEQEPEKTSPPVVEPEPEEAVLTMESFAVDESFTPEEPTIPSDDYAADHELLSIDPGEKETEKLPPMIPEQELPLPALNSGLSQLLKLVQEELKAQQHPPVREEPKEPPQPVVREPAPGQSGRYSVASKNRHGVVVHAPELEQKSAAQEEDPGWRVPETPAQSVKQIIISAEESYAYFGELLNGLREGQGRTEMQSGHTAYEGGYRADQRDGFGTYYYKSGKICYVGDWKQNLRHGQGISFSSRDGSVFVGKWKDNVPTGSGTAFDAEGNLIYTGEWKDGKRDGYGTEYRGGAVRYAGEWKEDRYNGKGTLTLANGTVLSGLFADGKAQGLEELL